MTPADINPVQAAELLRRSLMIADRAVVADIECECTPSSHAAGGWLDITSMVSHQEHAAAIVDMALEALEYARMRGLIAFHPVQTHLVRILRRP